ncbi:MAG: squalene/phytoene synthase family protein [Acidobacteriota bacterium]|nr:squalene/phytoene synthase family protein [Acidobacteriota bacterium]
MAADLDDLLVKTSRTFALSIPPLPEPTRREVTIAYLLFRVADTFEDASHWSRSQRVAGLECFVDLLESGDRDAAAAAAREWVAQGPSEHEGYVELMAEVPEVLRAFAALSGPAQEIIRRHVVRTSVGMAEIVERTADDGVLALDDVDDLKHYCYLVAGIVGELLTELFLLDRPRLDPVAGYLTERAATFGEALQLVNILKDSADDAREGRSYLPLRADRLEVFGIARGDLGASCQYVRALEEAGAERGLIAFTALPVLLACATLDRVEDQGPGAKLSRPEVARIVQEMNLALDEERSAVPA